MSGRWDGKPRRKSDFDHSGRVTIEVILARIDERVNTLIENGVNVKKELSDHMKDDAEKFGELNKTVWRASGLVSGGLAVFVFVLNFFFNKK